MEGLLNLANDFAHDAAAVARATEGDEMRDERLAALANTFDGFRRGDVAIGELVKRVGAAVREPGPRGAALWGFKHEDERAFPERLAEAGARLPDVDLSGVLRALLREAEFLSDEERVHRLLAFGDFVADLDSRGQEGDPRLGVGPSANFLTLAWHVLSGGRDPVFLFDSNKAIKAVSEASSDPDLRARDLEGRFRAFYLVARRLAVPLGALPLGPGLAVEQMLAWTLERISNLGQLVGTQDDPGVSGLWKPRPREELRGRPPSGRLPAIVAGAKPTVRIEPPRKPTPSEVARSQEPARADAAAQASGSSESKTERAFNIGKARTIRADSAPPPEAQREPEPVREPDRELVTPKPLPRIAARGPRPESGQAAPLPQEKPAAAVAATDTVPARRPRRDTSGELVSQALGELMGEIATAEADPGSGSGDASDETWRSERVARDLGFAENVVDDLLSALETRGRVVLAGPAATGKTYLARRIALHVGGRDERVVFLRLHASIGYDELVEMRRPDGVIEKGIARDLCERARRDRETRYVLVVDEVDKGDFSASFGELAGAIGERGTEIQLGRSREKVSFPKNLYFIATGRSVPSDMLGRFPIVAVDPDPEALRRFFARSRSGFEWVADLLRKTNERLAREKGPQARLGQGLLMDHELDNARLEGIWRREVLPYVRALGLDPKGFELSSLGR